MKLKLKFFIAFLFFIIVIFFLMGCQKKIVSGQKTPVELNPEEAQKFVAINNPERVTHNTFSMVKPKEWKEVLYASNTLIYLPPESSINDSFSEKISMIVGFVPENETRSLKEITEESFAKSKEIMPSIELVSEDDYRLGQIDGIRLVFTARIQNRTLEITQIRARQGRVVYAFSTQCEQGMCQHTDIFYEMAGSFEWKNPE